jgi:hypothetical protein
VAPPPALLVRQYLYFCTSNEYLEWTTVCAGKEPHGFSVRQHLYFSIEYLAWMTVCAGKEPPGSSGMHTADGNLKELAIQLFRGKEGELVSTAARRSARH